MITSTHSSMQAVIPKQTLLDWFLKKESANYDQTKTNAENKTDAVNSVVQFAIWIHLIRLPNQFVLKNEALIRSRHGKKRSH